MQSLNLTMRRLRRALLRCINAKSPKARPPHNQTPIKCQNWTTTITITPSHINITILTIMHHALFAAAIQRIKLTRVRRMLTRVNRAKLFLNAIQHRKSRLNFWLAHKIVPRRLILVYARYAAMRNV